MKESSPGTANLTHLINLPVNNRLHLSVADMTHLANAPVNNRLHLRCIPQNFTNQSGLWPADSLQHSRAEIRASNALAAAVPTTYLL